jgi:hypothetical protein
MKNITKNSLLLISLIGALILSVSCKNKELIRDADYPEQLIYMPAANYNNFTIDNVPKAIGYSPTPGYPEQFTVDTIARKFKVLLGVYRSGIDNVGDVPVNIAVNTDTITKLLAISGKLPAGTILLPSDKYSIPTSAVVADGTFLTKFELSIDLDYLRANYSPAKIFAIAVGVSSTARKTNPALATTIIVLNTRIMKPTAGFTSGVSPLNPKTINFTNTAVYGIKYVWDFGDGSPVMVTSNAKNETVSHTYAAAGSYTIKLTVIGVTDLTDKSVFTAVRVIP